jgi:shikimate kinase
MRGVGEATAAITIVNAIPTGIGAAAGIDLRSRAEVTLERRTGAPAGPPTIRPETARTLLVRAALSAAVDRLAPEWAAVTLDLRSDIPPATGLKSSSAVASAIARAVGNAAGRELGAPEAAALAAEVGRSSGTSATGAYDDALAGLVGEIVVTDNRSDRLLRTIPIEPELSVALWIPPGTHPPAPEARGRFPLDPRSSQAPVEAALAGRPWEAMELNSALVESAMGYGYGPVRAEVRRRGAIAAGTSGLGPAFAVVAPRSKVPALVRELAGRPGSATAVEFSRTPPAEAPS